LNVLGLPAFIILDMQHDDIDLHFTLETVEKPSFCPCCGTKRGNLVGYGRFSRQEAEHEYDNWLKCITPEIQPYFEPLTRAVENWHEEIFSYFDFLPNPITNAYTESLNGLIKLANKNGRGYKFDVLRAKILFTEGMHKISYPKFNKHIGQETDQILSFLVSEHGEDYQTRDHGTDIYTLIQKMEGGSFFSDQQ